MLKKWFNSSGRKQITQVPQIRRDDLPEKDLIMYSRSSGCPFVTVARRVLDEHAIPYTEIYIDKDPMAKQRVLDWTGFLSVPTLVIAECGAVLPYTTPEPLEAGASPRGIDRGPMMTEASASQLEAWLTGHGFIVPHRADEPEAGLSAE